MWRSRLWSISWLRHQMFYPYAAQASESDDLHNVMSLFSLFLSSFTSTKNLERPWRIVAVNPPKRGKRRSICGLHCDETGLQMLLSRMQTLNWDTAKVQNITDLIHCQREKYRLVQWILLLLQNEHYNPDIHVSFKDSAVCNEQTFGHVWSWSDELPQTSDMQLAVTIRASSQYAGRKPWRGIIRRVTYRCAGT